MTHINSYIICQVKETLCSRDGTVRSLKVNIVFGGKQKEFTRDIRRFSLLEIDDLKIVSVKNSSTCGHKNVHLNPTQARGFEFPP